MRIAWFVITISFVLLLAPDSTKCQIDTAKDNQGENGYYTLGHIDYGDNKSTIILIDLNKSGVSLPYLSKYGFLLMNVFDTLIGSVLNGGSGDLETRLSIRTQDIDGDSIKEAIIQWEDDSNCWSEILRVSGFAQVPILAQDLYIPPHMTDIASESPECEPIVSGNIIQWKYPDSTFTVSYNKIADSLVLKREPTISDKK